MSDKGNTKIRMLNVSPDLSENIIEELVEAEKQKAKNGLFAGSFFILIGAVFSVIGVSGVVNWNLSFGGLNSSLTNAAPGVILMIIGFLIILWTNFKVIIK
jgi:hypothetical protein